MSGTTDIGITATITHIVEGGSARPPGGPTSFISKPEKNTQSQGDLSRPSPAKPLFQRLPVMPHHEFVHLDNARDVDTAKDIAGRDL